MRLTAKAVQEMFQIPDDEIVAHGYKPFMGDDEPRTVDIWFENGHLVRAETDDSRSRVYTSLEFKSGYFQTGIKRWYIVHERLLSYFETFGDGLCVLSDPYNRSLYRPGVEITEWNVADEF